MSDTTLEKESSSSKSGHGGPRANAGRKPGVPNKTTAEVKQAMASFTADNIDHLTTWLSQVDDPSKRIDLFLKALEYTMPKLARSEMVGDENKPIVHVYKWRDNKPAAAPNVDITTPKF